MVEVMDGENQAAGNGGGEGTPDWRIRPSTGLYGVGCRLKRLDRSVTGPLYEDAQCVGRRQARAWVSLRLQSIFTSSMNAKYSNSRRPSSSRCSRSERVISYSVMTMNIVTKERNRRLTSIFVRPFNGPRFLLTARKQKSNSSFPPRWVPSISSSML